MSLGSRINDIRKEKNISIDELSELSGVPKGTLSKITAGITTKPSIDTVKAIARALDCSLDDFDDNPSSVKKMNHEQSSATELESLVHQLKPEQAVLMVKIIERALAMKPETYAYVCENTRDLWKG